jgi:putative addiction module component (TIGR02574 family)
MTKMEVQAAALQLPVEERTLLAHSLLESVEAEVASTPLTAEQRGEIVQRLQAFHANPERVLTWEEVEAELWPGA